MVAGVDGLMKPSVWQHVSCCKFVSVITLLHQTVEVLAKESDKDG